MHVYLPIVAAIREHNLLAEFPGKTETELYLSIVAYLDQLRQTEETDQRRRSRHRLRRAIQAASHQEDTGRAVVDGCGRPACGGQ